MRKGTSMLRVVIAMALTVCMIGCVQGCATTGPNGEQQQMSPESQMAITRIVARNAGRAVCLYKPELVPELALVSSLLSGENPTVGMFEQWAGVLSGMVGLDKDIEDLMIILQAEGYLDPEFNSTVQTVVPFIQECAKALNQGFAMCAPKIGG